MKILNSFIGFLSTLLVLLGIGGGVSVAVSTAPGVKDIFEQERDDAADQAFVVQYEQQAVQNAQ